MKLHLSLAIIWLSATAWGQTNGLATPIYPNETDGLIFLEAEDAFSTNFTQEATLDYASSGSRLLQLNKPPKASGAPFYSDYSFLVSEAGDYELWLGGTPPGPKDELIASYTSPFEVIIDGKKPLAVNREAVIVTENYSITNSWYQYKETLNLTPGTHTLRIQVSEPRRYDGKYYLFLDALFFLKKGTVLPEASLLPPKFPTDRTSRKFDNAYLSIPQYEAIIQTNVKAIAPYIDLAQVYSIIGNYQDALKVLARGRLNAGDNDRITLMMAKNRIWSGEWEEGLKLFREYLTAVPDSLATWAEAAKIFAWLGQYKASLDLYSAAIARFPDDLNLLVNYGLTYLWYNQISQGENILKTAHSQAAKSPELLLNLSHIFESNGYPDKAIATLAEGIKLFPNQLVFYLESIEKLVKYGREDESAGIVRQIKTYFANADRLNGLLANLDLKSKLKQKSLKDIADKLTLHPEDLKLRESLVQAYFWNGKKMDALEETWNILATKNYLQSLKFDQTASPVYELLDRLHFLRRQLSTTAQAADGSLTVLQKALSDWTDKNQPTATAQPGGAELLTKAETELILRVTQAANLADLQDRLEAEIQTLVTAGARATSSLVDEKKSLRDRQPWVFDAEATASEFKNASRKGNVLGDYLLNRLKLFSGDIVGAAGGLKHLVGLENPPAGVREAATQAELWLTGRVAAEQLTKAVYFPYGEKLSAFFDQFTLKEVASDLPFDNTYATRAGDLQRRFQALPTRANTLAAQLDKTRAQLLDWLFVQTQIQLYLADVENYQLRSQLGDYYLNLGRNAEAVQQLDKVLQVNPSNVSARFNLGRARQLSGDWSGAMDMYKQVFQTDPKFENTANLYNQLASLHANHFEANVATLVDSGRETINTLLRYQSSGTSFLSADTSYAMQYLRLLDGSAALQLHRFELATPLSFSGLGLSITPSVGGNLATNVFNWNNTVQGQLALLDQSAHLSSSPIAGLKVNWTAGPVNLTANYTFDQISDTFIPGRAASFENRGELSANLYWALPDTWTLKSLSTRTYGKWLSASGSGATPENYQWSGVQEINSVILLSDNPWTTLTVTGSGSWEDSTAPQVTTYYSPAQVLNLKAGGVLSSWIGLGGGTTLGLSGRYLAGSYQSRTESALTGEGGLRLEVDRQGWSLFVDLSASRSMAGNLEKYWSLQTVLGASISLPEYLIP